MSFDEMQSSNYADSNNFSPSSEFNSCQEDFRADDFSNHTQSSPIAQQVGVALDDEILEKLDIRQRRQTQDIQDNFVQDTALNKRNVIDKTQVKKILENVLPQDFVKIQNFVNSGAISPEQGQNLKKQIIKKTFDTLLQSQVLKKTSPDKINQGENSNYATKSVINESGKINPNFFAGNGRKEVLNYLKSGNIKLGDSDLEKISNIIRGVEYSAIERYLQKAAHDKNLRNANESAKQRLTANAQMSNFSNNMTRTFTREQIGKMSTQQFMKYEPIIMAQLKKGLIK